MIRLIAFITIFSLIIPGAYAACYTPAQYRAEQALRYHTNLMVMGLYCQKIMKQNTYATYQSFTARNQNVIRNEENQLVAYFKSTKTASPEKALHNLRTDLANKMSLQASKSIITFCRKFESNYIRSKTMIPADFQRWVEQIPVTPPAQTTKPLCAAAQSSK